MGDKLSSKPGINMPEIVGIEYEDLVATYGDRPEFFVELFRAFLDDAHDKLTLIEHGDAYDHTEYVSALHVIGVGLADVLAIGLSVRARELESAVAKSDVAYIHAHSMGFVADVRSLCSDIQAALPDII